MTVVLLLSQTVPLFASTCVASPEKHCMMPCCAAACGCISDAGETPQPSSSSQPPATGRDLLPQIIWVEAGTAAPQAKLFSAVQGRTNRPTWDMQAPARTQVRLTVLFCSLLT